MVQQPPVVLILDDDEAVRRSLVCYFEDSGWRVLAAVTGEDALGILADEDPAGAVVDMRLPGMNGNEFIGIAVQRRPEMVYVICTGSPEYAPPESISSLPQVSNRQFSKPVTNLAELQQALQQQISIYRKNRSAEET